MKQFITLFAAALVALTPAMATGENNLPENVKVETKTYQLSSFDKLDISWIYNVELTKDSRQKVEVSAPDFVLPYLQVKVRENALVLGVSNLPNDVRRKIERGNYQVTAKISMPRLTEVEMSGASKLNASGEFRADEFSMELSGASHLKGLRMNAREADLECSGASKFQISGSLKELDVDLSGAAKGEVESSGTRVEMDLSGSSKLTLTGSYDDAKVELSAAGNLKMAGNVNSARIHGSGATKADMLDCLIKVARVEMSGASSARVFVQNQLSVDLSGASKCQYKGADGLQLVDMDVDRASSLKKL